MDYLLTFLEGIISFISPCMLPMLPIYVSYFAAGDIKRTKTFSRALAFVLGFTVVFCLLGLAFGSIGAIFGGSRILNIVCGLVVIALGLSYLDVIKLPFLKGRTGAVSITGVVSAFLFGMVFSVSLTPCVGAFLGSALAQASSSGTVLKGMLLLLSYSLGIGVPFLISAMLINQLKGAFNAIKRHYTVINRICGAFLIIVGIFMMLGQLQRLLSVFSA